MGISNDGDQIRQSRMTVGVVVEKRPSASMWVDAVWRPVAVMPGASAAAPWTELSREEDGTVRYWAGHAELTLYRSDTEAYRFNLSGEPRIYVVFHPGGNGDFPYDLHLVTLSPYEAQDHLDNDEDLVEALPVLPQILAFLEGFVMQQPEPPEFRKRKRRPVDLEELKFSKEPIFDRTERRLDVTETESGDD